MSTTCPISTERSTTTARTATTATTTATCTRSTRPPSWSRRSSSFSPEATAGDTKMRTIVRWALTPLAVLLLASCGPSAKNAATDKTSEAKATPSSKSLAATVGGDLGRVIDNAGLKTALDGVGPYTLFAPPDAALKTGVDFTDPAMKAE